MTPYTSSDFLLSSLQRIEGKVDKLDAKQDDHAERLTRMEVLINERTSHERRRSLITHSTWATGVSIVVLGAWEALKAFLHRGF